MTFDAVNTPVLTMRGLSGVNACVMVRSARIWNDRPNPPSTSSRFRHGASSMRTSRDARSMVARAYATARGSLRDPLNEVRIATIYHWTSRVSSEGTRREDREQDAQTITSAQRSFQLDGLAIAIVG